MKKSKVTVNCNFCGVAIEKNPSRIKRSKNHYCSFECKCAGQRVSEEQKKKTKRKSWESYKKNNKEKVKEYNAQYRKEHKKEMNEANKEWYYKNREMVLEKRSKRYKEDEEYRKKENARCVKWAKENPEKALLQRQRYKKRGRITSRVRQVKKVAQKYNCEIGNEDEIRNFYEKILNVDVLECYYCKKQCGQKIAGYKKDATIDHKIPLSRGGRHSIENLVVACRGCNSMKCSKTDEEFFKFLEIIKDI